MIDSDSRTSGDLFRSEVTEHRQRLEGQVVLASPVSIWVITALLCAIVLTGLAVVVLGQYARQATIVGWLVPEAGTINLEARFGGVVENILVSEGQTVEEGEPLAAFSLETTLMSGEGASETVIIDLNRQILEVQRIISEAKRRHELELTQLIRGKSGLEDRFEALQQQIYLQTRRLTLADAQVSSIQDLVDQNAASKSELQRRQETVIVQQQSLLDLKQRAIELNNELSEIESAIEMAPIAARVEISEMNVRLTELKRQKTETATRKEYQLISPISGRVSDIHIKAGTPTREGQLAVTLLPRGEDLRAELYAPTRAVGFIEPGQEVRLLYDAFPYEQFGVGRGKVISVSSTPLEPEELAGGPGVEESVYVVSVELSAQHVAAYGAAQSLRPGMSLQAKIVFDRRSIWAWLTDPIRRVTAR